MTRNELINILESKGFHYNWDKYSNQQLYRIYETNIEKVSVRKKPIYHWFLQDNTGNFIEFSNYSNYLKACKKLNKKGHKIQVGETYETKRLAD